MGRGDLRQVGILQMMLCHHTGMELGRGRWQRFGHCSHGVRHVLSSAVKFILHRVSINDNSALGGIYGSRQGGRPLLHRPRQLQG